MSQIKSTEHLVYISPSVQCYVIQLRTEILTLSTPGYPESIDEIDPFAGEDDIF